MHPEQAETLQGLVGALSRYGDAPAIVVDGREKVSTVSFAALGALAHDVAVELGASGIQRGEPVGIVAPNSAAWIASLLGILAAGAAAMPLDPKQSARERKHRRPQLRPDESRVMSSRARRGGSAPCGVSARH